MVTGFSTDIDIHHHFSTFSECWLVDLQRWPEGRLSLPPLAEGSSHPAACDLGCAASTLHAITPNSAFQAESNNMRISSANERATKILGN